MADLAGDAVGSSGGFTAARYRGRLTPGAGTGLWSSAAWASVIGAGQPCANWTDDEQTGITRANSAFTFAAAGTYAVALRLPINGNAIYIGVRLNGSVGGVLYANADFHGADTSGEGNRPHLALITVTAGEVVTLQYARDNSGGASGQYGAPAPTIDGASFSLGDIAIWRVS